MEITLTEEEAREMRRAVTAQIRSTEYKQRNGGPVIYEPGTLERRLEVYSGLLDKLDGKEV